MANARGAADIVGSSGVIRQEYRSAGLLADDRIDWLFRHIGWARQNAYSVGVTKLGD
jgi:hypothetical protein